MTDPKLALICDYDYERSSGIDPARFLSQIDALRRTLEHKFPIKQIGLGVFILDVSNQEDAFEFMYRLEADYGNFPPDFTCNMKLKLVQLVPLEDEFKAWKKQILINEHEAQMLECSPEDYYSATLEKG